MACKILGKYSPHATVVADPQHSDIKLWSVTSMTYTVHYDNDEAYEWPLAVKHM